MTRVSFQLASERGATGESIGNDAKSGGYVSGLEVGDKLMAIASSVNGYVPLRVTTDEMEINPEKIRVFCG
jgi:hypothetical protein